MPRVTYNAEERYRVLRRYYVRGDLVSEIAEETGVRPGTIKNWIASLETNEEDWCKVVRSAILQECVNNGHAPYGPL